MSAKCHTGSWPVKAGAVSRCCAALTGQERCGKKQTRGSKTIDRLEYLASHIPSTFNVFLIKFWTNLLYVYAISNRAARRPAGIIVCAARLIKPYSSAAFNPLCLISISKGGWRNMSGCLRGTKLPRTAGLKRMNVTKDYIPQAADSGR